ncbi:hypothetical protein [Campylobacter corcagiensis]|uniref:Uncharacterized protein n=1 Tax=Campylobacter corcagiensis TaxID=1448857 RepID=A0A6M8MZH7_9BACT|nr:hypothetical protein [Campylobacter corcagiensis]QKF65562.1 hypothetical protein CCORG_a0026 [Campylobacter corcagiensis]QOQ86530.1 hypothetical protein IMC76_00105 [Campylobacter corcagiensis]
MKKLILILFLVEFVNAYCYKAPCQTQIQSAKANAISVIENSYKNNNNALNNLEKAYLEYEKALIEQNRLLENIKTIKANSLLEEKLLLFKLKKHNELRSKNIDIKNNKE